MNSSPLAQTVRSLCWNGEMLSTRAERSQQLFIPLWDRLLAFLLCRIYAAIHPAYKILAEAEGLLWPVLYGRVT